MIGVDQPAWIPTFTGLSVRQFGKLVSIVRGRGAEQTGSGRRWGLSLDDRVLLVAVYYRTNLTLRQVALLFDVSKSAAGRFVDNLGPFLALSQTKRQHSPDTVLIVDRTVRHKALIDRVEVKGLRHWVVAAIRLQLGAA